MRVHLLLSIGFIAAPLVAQPPLKPEDLCRLEGRVLNAATGTPLSKATLTLMRNDAGAGMTSPPTNFTTSTDAEGRFAMRDIEPGRYRLRATRTGFVGIEYNARGPNRSGTMITLERGQQAKELNFRLPPHAVITGRVIDPDGEPMENAMIQLVRTTYVRGKKQMSPVNNISTNDLGEYRMFGVAPGKYFVSATYRGMYGMNNVDRSATPAPEEDFVPVWYPGTTDAAAAVQIDVAAGAQVSNINLKLAKAHTVHVRGRVTQSVATGRANTIVILLPRTGEGMALMMMMNRNRTVDAKGAFDIPSVAPGSYMLRASTSVGNKSYSASVPVDVGAASVENVVINIVPGAPLAGRLRPDREGSLALDNVRVQLMPRETATIYMNAGNAKVGEDGGFRMDDVSPEQYNLSVYGLPDGYYVKTIRYGETDISSGALDLPPGGSYAPLDIIVSPEAGQVSGGVQNPKTQQPAPGAMVVLIPQEPERRNQNSFYKTVTTDQLGNFTLKNLTPGQYKVFAWEDIEPGSYFDSEVVKPVEGSGEKVEVKPNGQHSVQLTLIPAGQA